MQLSPIDHAFTGRDSYAVEFLMVFPYRIDAGRLRTALAKTISHFWPIQSELVGSAGPGGFYQFKKTSQPVSLEVRNGGSVLPNFQNPKELAGFSDPVHSLPGEVLSRFCLTYVGDHSVFVANISHTIVDGYSYFFFLGMLATYYRESLLSFAYWKNALIRPDLDRSKLQPSEAKEPAIAKTAVDPEEFFRRTGFSYASTPRTLPSLANSRWEFIRFPAADVLKHLDQHQSKERLSKHDIVTALLWKRVAEEWHQTNDMLECSSAFDYRRVHGGLSPLYWGNAVRGTTSRVSRDEILKMDVPTLATSIRQATRAVNRAAVFDALEYLNDVRRVFGPGAFAYGYIAHPKVGLLVTNLSRIDAKAFDFGKGPPLQVIPLTAAPRAAVLLSDGDTIVARLGLPQ